MEVQFEGHIPTWVQDGSCNKSKQSLNICVSLVASAAGQRKDLNIRVTNPGDAFMMYSLRVTEDEYHHLKTQQGLLIDFPSFPSKFIELLRMCETGRDKFELHLLTQHSTASMQVVEVNPFKHLVHLSLALSTATDSVVKQYLADCLRELQKKHHALTEKSELEMKAHAERVQGLEETMKQLQSQLQGDQQSKEQELREQGDLMKEQLLKEREAAASYQQKLKDEADLSIKQLENRAKDLENKNKKIFDEKCRFELQNRELIAKVKFHEEERQADKGEIERLKLERAERDKERQNDMRELRTAVTELAVVRQELKDTAKRLASLQEQLELSEALKSKLENQIDTQHFKCEKLENTLQSVSQEVVKGNEIIQRMQGEMKEMKMRLKNRGMQIERQKKTIKESEERAASHQRQVTDLQSQLNDRKEVLERTEACRAEMESQIEEYQKTLKSNENVIAWLNKQINDRITPRSLPSLLPGRGDQNLRPDLCTRPGAYRTSSTSNIRKEQAMVTPTIIPNSSLEPQYHHLSSFETRKDDSLLDDCYLRDHVVEDTLTSDTPQTITIGRKPLQQKQNTSQEQHRPTVSFKQGDPPLLKAYAAP